MATDDARPPGGTEPFEAVDSAGTGDRITVYVRDRRDGEHYRVHFRKSLHGKVKHDGGGRFRPSRRAYYRAACRVAREYVEDVLGYAVVERDEWTVIKPEHARRIVEEAGVETPQPTEVVIADVLKRIWGSNPQAPVTEFDVETLDTLLIRLVREYGRETVEAAINRCGSAWNEVEVPGGDD